MGKIRVVFFFFFVILEHRVMKENVSLFQIGDQMNFPNNIARNFR